MHTGKQKQMNASYQASLVNRHIRRFTGIVGFEESMVISSSSVLCWPSNIDGFAGLAVRTARCTECIQSFLCKLTFRPISRLDELHALSTLTKAMLRFR